MEERADARPDGSARARVLVVDDHKTFTDLVLVALDGEPDLVCVGAAHHAAAARTLTAQLEPDVVLMDVNLKAEDGLELTAELLAARPELRVVVLTAHSDAKVMRRAAKVGACALLPKDGSLPELLDAIRHARPGGFQVHPTLLHALVTEQLAEPAESGRPPALTPQEKRVLDLLAEGRDVRDISRQLGISVHTCRGYVKALLAKLDAHSQLEAVVVARTRGLIGGPRSH
jgi:DNA-binding NarL/FixJ family response regulator